MKKSNVVSSGNGICTSSADSIHFESISERFQTFRGACSNDTIFCFGILCISFLWGVIFDGHGGRQRQEFYVLEWLIGVMDRKWAEP
ncbi:hypothetical protein SUGI_0916750 [Cryptomeria japonica]|nr:hypothetical protein SUGI_0916750 [Cryptomeria japonica]